MSPNFYMLETIVKLRQGIALARESWAVLSSTWEMPEKLRNELEILKRLVYADQVEITKRGVNIVLSGDGVVYDKLCEALAEHCLEEMKKKLKL